MASVAIKPADWTEPRVLELLRIHHDFASFPDNNLPEGEHYALTHEILNRPGFVLYTAWDVQSDKLLGCAALNIYSAPISTNTGTLVVRAGEIKSMHTAAAVRGRGIGVRLLDHIADEAREMGITDLFVETGSTPPFAPARRCYEKAGWVVCGRFGDYEWQDNSVFMTLPLAQPSTRI